MIDQPISGFMSRRVVYGDEETPLREIVSRMRIAEQSAFIVCDERRAPIGVITESDAIGLLEGALAGHFFENTRACDIMATPVTTLPESACMSEVIRIMTKRTFRRIPIVDDKGQLTGIVNLTDLQDAMNTALERRGRDLEVAVMARTAELQAANEKLERLSQHDGLTGLLNRRAMSTRMAELHSLCERHGNPYSVILMDIDHFKLFNDSQGHLQGDAILETIANTLERSVRVADSVFRYGGEEFLVTLPETSATEAELVAERIRQNVEALGLPHPASPTADHVTLSLGVASIDAEEIADIGRWEDLVERADRALYRAKESGRNRVVGWKESDRA